MRLAPKISFTDEQLTQLQSWAKSRTTAVRLAQRAKMILMAGAGAPDTEIAARVGWGAVGGPWRAGANVLLCRDSRALSAMRRAQDVSRRSRRGNARRLSP